MANMNFVAIIIALTVAVIIGSAVLLPTVNSSTGDLEYTESLTVASEENVTDTLTQSNLVSGSLSITGLTVTTNYTVNYDTGVVSFVNGTSAGTYPASYDYYTATYLDNASERTLLRILILVFIIGLLVWAFAQFGLG